MEIKEFKDALVEMQNALDAKMNERINAQKDSDAASYKSINEKVGELIEAKEALREQLNAISAKQSDIKIEHKSNDEIVQDFLVKNADKLKSMQNTKNGIDVNFNVKFNTKAAGTITTGNYSGGTVGLSSWDPEFARVVRRQPFLRQLVSVRPVSTQYVAWAEQSGRDGGAGNTAEGAAKTQADFDIVERNKIVEKITAYSKASKESLADISFLQSEINNDLLSLIELKLDTDLLGGSGTTPVMKGILTYAPTISLTSSPFATAGGGVAGANNFDVLRLAAWYIETQGLGAFVPNVAVVHPTTAAQMDLTKITDNSYVMPPFSTAGGQVVSGLRVVTNTGITSGDFLVGDFSKSNLAIREDVNIQIGYENDDFTKNLVTILAEMRAVHYIKTNHNAAFVKGTFATVKTAMATS